MSTTPAQHLSRTAAVIATSAALVVAPVAAADAHVRVSADTTAAGGYALLVFRVPTESDTASTTGLQVDLPTDHPFTYAAVQPLPGWTAEVTEGPLPAPVDVAGTTLTSAPLTITWTAQEGTGIAPGEFLQFPVVVGALPPEGTTVLMPATQTYDDGTEVAWSEPVPAGGEEPDLPAPQLVTTAAGDDDGPQPTGPGTWLGLAGAVLGAAGLVVALLRRRSADAS